MLFLQISGSSVVSLGAGSDTKKTTCEVSIVFPTTTSGSVTIKRKTASSVSQSVSYYTKYSDGTNTNDAVSASADVSIPSGGGEIFVSSSLGGGPVALYYTHVAN